MATLINRRFDIIWFVLPGAFAAVVATAIGCMSPSTSTTGLGLWITGVLLVDVAHVWASLYRTYLDPEARALHGARLWITPLIAFGLGLALHLYGPELFWRVLAYIAIFHFIKQHVGFAHLYLRANHETLYDRRIVEALVWASTAGPVLWWHTRLPRNFAWFLEGDLITGLPSWLGTPALLVQIPLWMLFALRRLHYVRIGRRNPLLTMLLVVTALNWHLGIVIFNDDRVFTITNVFAHGIPYLALTWVTGGQAWVQHRCPPQQRHNLVFIVGVYYGLLCVLAFTEECLWDRWIWHDHPALFGSGWLSPAIESHVAAVLVALLTVPQATHYVLDRWIWRPGPRNPHLASQLGLTR